MTLTRWLLLALRLAFVAFCLLTALYGLFAYVPFTYTQVLQARVVDGFFEFAAWHRTLAWLGWALLTLVLWRPVFAADPPALVLVIVFGLATVGLTVHPVLAPLGNDRTGLVVAGLAVVPVIWLAVADLLEFWRFVRWQVEPPDDATREVTATIGAAVTAGLASLVLWWVRAGRPAPVSRLAAPLVWVLSGHLFIAAVVVAVCGAVRGVVRSSFWRQRAEFVITAFVLGLALAALIRNVGFAAIGFSGAWAWLAALACAWAVVMAAASAVVQVAAATRRPLAHGLDLWCAPGGRGASLIRLVLLASLVLGAALAVEQRALAFDWNFLLQKMTAAVTWLALFAVFYGATRSSGRIGWVSALSASAALSLVFAVVGWTGDRSVADAQATHNPSFRLVRDGLLRGDAGVGASFFEYLAANTNIPRERRIDPVRVDFTDGLAPASTPVPDIFVIVVDSLRRDYLSPYNPAVTFTPAIERLAADSDVFTRAFTRYGATGLSEPAIWAGGMLIHKQYVTPFAPMNTLDRLLDAESYQQLVSVDSILRTLLPASPRRAELDAGIPNKDYDLCRSLDELSGRLDGHPPAQGPVFAYTQPQNLHVSAITRGGNGDRLDAARYQGFYAPYASRVERIDGCLGTFVDRLKASGRYDRSVIVLTSDHGDSLGEDGRFGHAYTIFPEIMRVPLLVHVPTTLRAGFDVAKSDVAFTVDITPSLYALLGHAPTKGSVLTGRTLYRPRGAPPPAARPDVMVASSYGAVYGLLSRGGRHLYIVDAVNFAEHAYEIGDGVASRVMPVSDDDRVSGQAEIRKQVAALAALYRFEPGVK